MALDHLQSGLNGINAFRFSPLNLGQTPPEALPPYTAEASKAAGHAALMGTVAKTISELPQMLVGSYLQGKAIPTQVAANDLAQKVLSGNATPKELESYNIFRGKGALSPEQTEAAKTDLDIKKAKLKQLQENPDGLIANPSLQGGNPASPTGTAKPRRTSGGVVSDPMGEFNEGDVPLPFEGEQPTEQPEQDQAPMPPGESVGPVGALSAAPSSLGQGIVSGALATDEGRILSGEGNQLQSAPAAPAPVAAPATTAPPITEEFIPGGKLEYLGGDKTTAKTVRFRPDRIRAGGPQFQEKPNPFYVKPQEGQLFDSPEAIKAAGIDPTGATIENGKYRVKAYKPADKPSTVPAQIRSEAVRMGVWKEGMTAEDAGKAMENKQIKDGVIPPHLLPAAQSLARMVVQHPALKHLPTIREAKEAVDAGIANPGAGGFSDMALIEGFQRMVNPGATVRTQTMESMKQAAGWLQNLDPKYQWEKAIQGDKFSPEARIRLKKLSEDIYQRALKNAAPQLNGLKKIAKSYGVSEPDAFIENVMVVAPMFDVPGTMPASGAPATPGGAELSPKDKEALEWYNSEASKASDKAETRKRVEASLRAKGLLQ